VAEFSNGWKGKDWLRRQWPWWTAGVLTGLAEVINYTLIPLGHPKHKFIGVTSCTARMYAAFETTLFGGSLIATKADYQPSIQWVIVGAMIAALVSAWLEGEWRTWVKYPKPILFLTVLGGALFARTRRLQPGRFGSRQASRPSPGFPAPAYGPAPEPKLITLFPRLLIKTLR